VRVIKPIAVGRYSNSLRFPISPPTLSVVLSPTILRFMDGLLYVMILVLLLVPVLASLTGSVRVLNP
jgi:hypothetical protein